MQSEISQLVVELEVIFDSMQPDLEKARKKLHLFQESLNTTTIDYFSKKLPLPIFDQILSYCELKEMGALANTCKKFLNIVKESATWKKNKAIPTLKYVPYSVQGTYFFKYADGKKYTGSWSSGQKHGKGLKNESCTLISCRSKY
eukprot:TRINITY_DN3794_c0_g1_i3.p1 TRINITY_DN3794_c0_g1~~TRINITY_DN3794_c0_g1_i3.p1  ORF type:complete len:155 (+),score=26.07 TRINITY_DN3794_c0_g1_i3:33-467(+)